MRRAISQLPKSRRQFVREKIPAFIEPQLALLRDAPPVGDKWVHEVKFDGYRMQMRVHKGRAALRTRKGLDWSARFPEIARHGNDLPDGIYDGEICAVNAEGQPDFAGLQTALRTKRTAGLVYFIFDLLYRGDEDLRAYALKARKAVLQDILGAADDSRLRYVEHIAGDGDAMFESACRMRLEGIVSKDLTATYRSDRGGAWIKTKCRPLEEFVVGGWAQEGRQFKALLLGAFDGKSLRYVGHAGTGFGAKTLGDLLPRLKALEIQARSFEGNNAPAKKSVNHWVKPELVAQVAFESWTASGKLRQASFKGLREDKKPREITLQTISLGS